MNRVFKRSFGRYVYDNNLRLQPGVECQLNLRDGQVRIGELTLSGAQLSSATISEI
jgi:hypothetical protein